MGHEVVCPLTALNHQLHWPSGQVLPGQRQLPILVPSVARESRESSTQWSSLTERNSQQEVQLPRVVVSPSYKTNPIAIK